MNSTALFFIVLLQWVTRLHIWSKRYSCEKW